jgi:hypothetical protein
MNGRDVRRSALALVMAVGVVLGGALPVQAEPVPGDGTTVRGFLAAVGATFGTLFYAPFKVVIVCPVSAVGAGATWLASGGESSPADSVLRVGCQGSYFITADMVRGEADFREPDAPEAQMGGETRR